MATAKTFNAEQGLSVGTGATLVIDSSRNITAGTIGSGAITVTSAGITQSGGNNSLTGTTTIKTAGNNPLALENSITFTKTATGTISQNTIVVSPDNTSITLGQKVTGTGIGTGATVTNIAGTTITLSVVNAGAVSGTMTFSHPTAYLGTTGQYALMLTGGGTGVVDLWKVGYDGRFAIGGGTPGATDMVYVNGNANIVNNLTVGGTLITAASLSITANSTFGTNSGNTVTVNGTTTFAAGVTFSSTAAFNGNVTLGDAAGDTITINGVVTAGQTIKIGNGAASPTQGALLINKPSGNVTAMQIFQDGVESWSVGMDASSGLLRLKASTVEFLTLNNATGELRVNGNAVFKTADATAANNSGVFVTNIASATAGTRAASITLDPNGADASGVDYTTLRMYGSGEFEISNQLSTGIITFKQNAGNEAMRISTNRNLIIGTTTDDATNKLQVTGSAKITGDFSTTGHVTLTDSTKRIQVYGTSTSWGSTAGTTTGAVNTVMGVASGATWLISGTSGGTFRAGVQVLDAGGALRIYEGANYIQYGGSILTFSANSQITSLGNLGLYAATTSFVDIDTGTTGSITIGTNANAKTITIGNSIGATAVNLNVGTGHFNVKETTAITNTAATALIITHETSGTPAAGIGTELVFSTETAAANNEWGASIASVSTDVTSTSEDFDLVFYTMAAGAARAERARMKSTGILIAPIHQTSGASGRFEAVTRDTGNPWHIYNTGGVLKFWETSDRGSWATAGLTITGTLTATSTLTHGGLSMTTASAGSINTDQTYTFTMASTAISTTWVDTGIDAANELVTGVYTIRLQAGTNEFYVGVMPWFSGNGAATLNDEYTEIPLMKYGDGGTSSFVYVRILRTTSAAPKLQISASTSLSAYAYALAFRRLY